MAYTITAQTNALEISSQVLRDARKHPQIINATLNRLAFFSRKDGQDSMKRDLDRPKRFTLNALIFSRSSVKTLRSSVFVNRNNTYLHYMVFGGLRKNERGRILVPSRALRTDAAGNLSRGRRRRLVNDPKTFVKQKGGQRMLLRRVRRRVQFVATLEQTTRYRTTGYWKFFESAENTFDSRFPALFRSEHRRFIAR